MYKLLLKFGVLLVILLVSTNPGFAAYEDVEGSVDGGTSIGRCIAKGNVDFILFLNASLGGEGFVSSLYEPWEDVLTRNQCHGQDILGLTQKKDKLRDRIRNAFFTCNTQKIPKLRTGYIKANAEIYYVRNVVDGLIIASLPYDLLSTRMLEDPDALFTSRDVLYSEMKDRYSGGDDLSEEEFNKLFLILETKYSNRKKDYVVCETSSWETVAEKWEEFVESGAGGSEAVDDFEKGVSGRAEKIIEAGEGFTMKGYVRGIFQTNVNQLESKAGVQEIADRLVEQFGDTFYSAPTQSDVINSLSSEDFRYETDKLEILMRSEYESLYKEGSDVSIELFVNEVKRLNELIDESFGPINTVFQCSKMMNSRQCK